MTPHRVSALRLDAADPLAEIRSRFTVPDGVTYLDGNSLGALSTGVGPRLDDVIRTQWGDHLIRAWNDDDWWSAPVRIGDRIGRLIGAASGQTTVGETTSVQLFNALVAAARLRPERSVILTDPDHFPTNRYLAASVGRLLGLDVRPVPVRALHQALRRYGAEVAVVSYGAVDYRTGERWDIGGLTAAAHEAGAVAVWDLCHAVGVMPLAMDTAAVDFAVGCTYKYLSGGPGAPAFISVAARHHERFDPALTGWTGHREPFAMTEAFQPAAGISRARIGTPHVLSLLALDAALDAFDDVDLAAVRTKSLSLTDRFIAGVDRELADSGLEVVTPREHTRRGSQVSLRHPQAYPIMAALIERGVIGDVRPPDLMRFGVNPLYLSHADIDQAITTLGEVMRTGAFRQAGLRVPGIVS